MWKRRRLEEDSDSPDMDELLKNFLARFDPSSPSLDRSFKKLVRETATSLDEQQLIRRAFDLGSGLRETAMCRYSVHNLITWALHPDLNNKVFYLLDIRSLCCAAATCQLFRYIAMNPKFYADIDLTLCPTVNDAAVSTLISRAQGNLQSLKLGIVLDPTTTSRLTRSCLTSLSDENVVAGALLKKLHLYNIESLDKLHLCLALSACPSLLDLKIVNIDVKLNQILKLVGKNCHLLKSLFFESATTGYDKNLKDRTRSRFIHRCPCLSSLSLRGVKLQDDSAVALIEGFPSLVHVDFSKSYPLTGSFMRNIGRAGCDELSLAVLILRDCVNLKDSEVVWIIESRVYGNFPLHHLDVSSKYGLTHEGDDYKQRLESWKVRLKNSCAFQLVTE